MSVTIYASIGNSDDKLTQREWAEFQAEFIDAMKAAATEVHGVWFSGPGSPYQNACVCIELDERDGVELKSDLRGLRRKYRQSSIAFADAATSFI